MTSRELAEELSMTQRAVRKATYDARKKGQDHFVRKGKRIKFELVEGIGGRGEVYKYTIEKTPVHSIDIDIKTKVLRTEAVERAELKAKLASMYINRMGTYEQFMDELPVEFECLELNRIKLMRIVKQYKEAMRSGDDPVKRLIDKRGSKKGHLKLSKKHKEAIQRFLLRRDIRPTISGMYKNLKVMFEDIPSIDTVTRYAKEWQQKNRLLYEISQNPDAAKNKMMPAFGSRSEKAMYANHYWELDATPADVVCADGKRWTIVGLIDIHSRRVAINMEETNNSYAVARNLRHGLLKLGVPENAVIDNGRDYTSNHMESCFTSLGVNPIKTPPYSGEYKPHIERFFGTMARELFREIEGFVGHSVIERQQIKAGLSYEDRLNAVKQWRQKQKDEKEFSRLWKKSKQYAGLEIEVPLTSDELKTAIDAYVDMYENRPHSGIGTTPIEKFDQSDVRRIANNRSLDFLLGESKFYTVRKEGIKIVEDGVRFLYAATELFELVGERVRVVRTDALDEIAVYDSDGEFVCMAEDPSYSGKSREAFKTAAKKWRKAAAKADRAVKEATKLAKEKDKTIMDRLELAGEREVSEEIQKDLINPEKKESANTERHIPDERPAFFKDVVDMFEWMALHPEEWNENDKLIKEENEELYEQVAKRMHIFKSA